MKTILLFILTILICLGGYAQTTIIVEPGPIDQTNTDGPALNEYLDIDISDCTSIQFSVDFGFSDPWEGSGNMEYLDECAGCAGDLNDPTSGNCFNCWDFMWIQYIMDGNVLEEEVIGDAGTTDAEQFGTFQSGIYCTDGIESADIIITNQNWAGTETNTFSNLVIFCWEGQPEINTNDPICGTEDLDLMGSATDESVVDDWEWTNDGTGSIDDPDVQNTFASGPEDGENYTLTTTDINGCEGTETIAVSIDEVPEIFPAGPLEVCDIDDDGEDIFDLTTLNDIVSGGNGTVIWYEDSGLANQIGSPDSYFSDATTVYAVVEDNGCTSPSEPVDLELLENPEPEAVANALFFCIGDGQDLELDEVGIFGDSWIWSGPDGFSSTEQDPVVTISSTSQGGTYTVTVTDASGQCTATDEIDITVGELPAVAAEADPAVACGGADISLNETAGEATSWMWTGPNGYSSMMQSPVLTSVDGNSSGIYTVVVSDAAGCTASDEVMVTVGAITAGLTGGADLCVNECTDASEDIMFELSGGSEPYNIVLTVNGVPLPGFGIDATGTVRICHDEDLLIPDIDSGSEPVILSLPDSFFPLDIELISVTDNTGCMAAIDPAANSVSLNLLDQPEAMAPNPGIFCVDESGTVNLTVMDNDITGGNGNYTVQWFNDALLQDEIPDPGAYDVNNGISVYAVVSDGECLSEPIPVELEYYLIPVIEITGSIEGCTDAFELPAIAEIANITNANNPLYFLDAALQDGPYTPGSIINPEGLSQIFLFDSNGPCETAAPIPFNVNIPPTIVSPLTMISACGTLILPLPELEGTVTSFEYNTESDGTGIMYLDGDEIVPEDNIDLLYLIASGMDGCASIEALNLLIDSTLVFSAPIEDNICGDLVLPDISPATPDVAYFTGSSGSGMQFQPGDTLLADSGSETFYDLFIFDPNLDADCAEEVMISFSIASTPVSAYPEDTLGCGTFVLPPYAGIFSDPDYSLEPLNDTLFFLEPGDSILTDQIVYILDTIGNCSLLDSFEVIVPAPVDAGVSADLSICEGFDVFTFDLMDAIGSPDLNGTWTYPFIPDFNPSDSTVIDLSPIPQGDYIFSYTLEDTCGLMVTEFDLEVISPPYAGQDSVIAICPGEDALDLMVLLANPEPGGTWIQAGGPATIDISDSTNVDFSGSPAGDYAFTYLITADFTSALCDAQAASLVIQITEGANAGDNIQTAACFGETIDLYEIIDPQADVGGVFEPDGFLLNGTTWNTSAVQPNVNYEIEYIVASSGQNCPADTSFLEIFLTESISAGDPSPANQVCEGETVPLEAYLENETPGGIFSFGPDPGVPIPNDWTADVSTTFSYYVEGTPGCPADSVSFMLVVNEQPALTYGSITADLCAEENTCQSIELDANSFVAADFTITEAMSGETWPIAIGINDYLELQICFGNEMASTSPTGDTLFLGTEPGIYNISPLSLMDVLSYCTTDISTGPVLTYNIRPVYEETLQYDLCPGDSVFFDNIAYASSTELMYTTMDGCDSIVILEINALSQVPGMIELNLCDGESLDILGMIFRSDTVGTFVFPGASSNGCDSIVDVDLDFEPAVTGTFRSTLCQDETVAIAGEVFDAMNPSGMVTIANGSSSGCDSIIDVDLDFYPPAVNQLMTRICEDESIQIGADIYNVNNTSGTTVLPGMSSNGCDSVITVVLDIAMQSEQIIDDIFCIAQDLVINGTVYNIDNPAGMEVLEGGNSEGCDSIIVIDISYEIPAADISVQLACPGEEGALVIESVEGLDFPFDIFLNGVSGGTFTTLPVIIPASSDMYAVELVSDDCSYSQILEVETLDTSGFGINAVAVGTNQFQLSPAGIPVSSAAWSSPGPLSCTDCNQAQITINQDTPVQLLAYTSEGCQLWAEIVLPYTEVVNYYIPNIIDLDSPDNNRFYVQSNTENLMVEQMIIYDRWGNIMFESSSIPVNDPESGWNGYTDNIPAEQGVYVYLVKLINTEGNTEIRSGDIMVLR